MREMLITGVVALMASVACAQAPATTDADSGSEIVARIGDEVITAAELDDSVRAQLLSLRQKEYEIKMQQLDRQIFDKLVAQAAAAEGITTAEYIKKNVADRAGEPDEGDIVKTMSRYRAQLNPDDAEARKQVVAYLQQQAQQRYQAELRERLFAESGVQIMLEPLRFEPVIEDYHYARGGDSAPVVIVEYTDFQCPFCSRVQPALTEIIEVYGDQVQHVFKHLPLAMHAQAKMAAEASMCAGDQDKFWELHDWMFANAKQINRESLTEQATALEIDVDAFNACLDGGVYRAAVEQDMKEAQGFGITGTPGFLINGRVLKGAQPKDEFIKIINDELRRAGEEIPEMPEDTAEGEQQAAAASS